MKTKKRILSLLLCGAMLFSLCPRQVLAVDSSSSITYFDENGDEQTTTGKVTIVDNTMTEWEEGWYIASGNVEISKRVTVSGNVHLILEDNAALTVTGGINVTGNNSLTIYGQRGGTGKLTAQGGKDQDQAGIAGDKTQSGGVITINGGTVNATGGSNDGAGIGGGGRGDSGGTITINGGTVNATGASYGAGIGGGYFGSGGTININGGIVTAAGGNRSAGIGGGSGAEDGERGGGPGGMITITGGMVTAIGGDRAAGIGGGSCKVNQNGGSGGDITITGGMVTATGGAGNTAGIGGGIGGNNGTFKASGDAVIKASTIRDKSNQGTWSGVIFEGSSGKVYGNQTLHINLEIETGQTLTISENTTLTIQQGVILTNDGTLINGGIITGDGMIDGSGRIIENGTIENTIKLGDNVKYQRSSSVTISFSSTENTEKYGSNITITAEVAQNVTQTTRARAAENTVEFFVGTGSNKKSLGTANVETNIATLSNVTISTENGWSIGENTITAEFGGSDYLKKATGTSTFNVTAIKLQTPGNLQWNSNTPGKATWSAVTNASGYSIQLYKDGSTHGDAVPVNGTDHTFTITEAGSYTFKVKATSSEETYTDSEETESGKLFTVSFDTNGAGTVPIQFVTDGGNVRALTAPTKTGYTFMGWYSDSAFAENSKWDFSSNTVTQAMTLYAKWEVNTYTVTLNQNGGTIEAGKEVTRYTYGVGATLPTADDMTYTGHTFKGWYDNSSVSGSSVTAISDTETGNKEYWAKWEANTYSVTLNANGGTIADGKDVTSYTYGVGATLPTVDDMTRKGYIFAGWYKDNKLSGNPVTKISDTDIDNQVFYAKWLSTDAGVTAVSVDGKTGTIDGTTFTIVLPYGTTSLPADNSKISITPAMGAKHSAPATSDNGKTWTFTVTAEDGKTTKNYTIKVSIAPDPATENQNDVNAAKSIIENHEWTVPQATANTEEAVKTWIESQLAAMNLNGASYEVTMTGGSFTTATEGNAADRDGTNGSFAFAVKLSKGKDTGNVATSTYAEMTVTISDGTIAATPYISPGTGGILTGPSITLTDEDGGTGTAFGKADYNWLTGVLTITPAEGYQVKDVLVSGQSKGAVTEVKMTIYDKVTVVFEKKAQEPTDPSESDAEKQARIIKGVQATTIRIYSMSKGAASRGKGWIRIWYEKSPGYKVDYYEVFRSKGNKKHFGKTAFYTTKKNGATGWYKNNKSLKKGTRYYYKIRGVRVIDGKKCYTKWSNIIYRTAK